MQMWGAEKRPLIFMEKSIKIFIVMKKIVFFTITTTTPLGV